MQKFKETGDAKFTFTKMNQIKLVLKMIWLMELLKIKQKQQLQRKF